MIRHAPSIGIGIGLSLRGSGVKFSGLLDQYGGAAVAYSLRALSSGWLAGDVVEVRRSSDSTSQGFTANQITNGDLVAFCGVGDGFVSIWYDQSGNANNLTNLVPLEQRKIVDTGVLVTEGGSPAIAGNIYGYDFDSSVVLTGAFSILTLANIDASQVTLGSTGSNPRLRYFATSLEVVNNVAGEVNFINSNNAPTSHTFDGARVLTGLYRDGSNSISLTIAGEEIASSPLTLSGTFSFNQAFSRDANLNPMDTSFQEMIIWPTDIR